MDRQCHVLGSWSHKNIHSFKIERTYKIVVEINRTEFGVLMKQKNYLST